MAHFALDIHVRQKVHLDLDQAVSFAVLTTAAFDIETETACVIPTHTCRWQLREQLAYGRKRPSVRDGIQAGRSANRALVNHDCLVDLFHSSKAPICARFFFRIVETKTGRISGPSR